MISNLINPVWSILRFKFSLSPVKLPVISEPFKSNRPDTSEKLLLKNWKFLISKANLLSFADADSKFLENTELNKLSVITSE